MKRLMALVVSAAMVVASTLPGHAQNGLGPLFGGVAGGLIGGAHGNRDGAIVGAIIGVAMGTILEQLSAQERAQRQAALQKAARGKSASWSTSGKQGKKASYSNIGSASTNEKGERCQKVQETITLADGKQGKSVETVCFS